MSFPEQERLLFDLLFNPSTRQLFQKDADNLLSNYELDKAERDDFKTIRIDALELDANMRVGLLLSGISRSFPVTFSLVSSLPNGITFLKSIIDTKTMHAPPQQRASVFGSQLREQLSASIIDKPEEQPLILAILEAELGMAWTAATLKKVVLEQGAPADTGMPVSQDWASKPVGLAPFVSVAILPLGYENLKQKLCPKTGCDVWSQLQAKPLAAARRSKVLQQKDPRLLVARAHISHVSKCEPAIDHQTLELSEGFAHLFQHVNGNNSVEQLLGGFKQAGAPDALLESVRTGFKQLLEKQMLEINTNSV